MNSARASGIAQPPAFAFSLLFFEWLEAVVGNPALHRVLTGVAAAVVGIIAATVLQLGPATAVRVSRPVIAAVMFGDALTVAWRVEGAWATPAILAAGGTLGALVAV